MSIFELVVVCLTLTFNSLCVEYAKDLKRFIDGKLRKLHGKVKAD